MFDLSDRSIFADNEWVDGQVEVYTHSILIEVKVTNNDKLGWVAFDEFLSIDGPSCETIPNQAAVTSIPPDTTTDTTPAQTTTPGMQ